MQNFKTPLLFQLLNILFCVLFAQYALVYDIQYAGGLKLLTTLRIGLSHLCEHKFGHNWPNMFFFLFFFYVLLEFYRHAQPHITPHRESSTLCIIALLCGTYQPQLCALELFSNQLIGRISDDWHNFDTLVQH